MLGKQNAWLRPIGEAKRARKHHGSKDVDMYRLDGDGEFVECEDDSGDGHNPDRSPGQDALYAYAEKCIERVQGIVPGAQAPECTPVEVSSACQLARKGKNRSALDKLGKSGVASRPAVALKAALQPQLAQVASGIPVN